jgi:hypothetical protein
LNQPEPINDNPLSQVLKLIQGLELHGIDYLLQANSKDALMLLIAIPGERWEIEIDTEGEIEVERFRSNGEISDESELDALFDR